MFPCIEKIVFYSPSPSPSLIVLGDVQIAVKLLPLLDLSRESKDFLGSIVIKVSPLVLIWWGSSYKLKSLARHIFFLTRLLVKSLSTYFFSS